MPKYVAISREHFANRRWKAAQNSACAAHDMVVPIVGAEISKIIPVMPMAFIRQNDQFQLSALSSLRADRNMFVGPKGNWLGAYVPAAIRAYPFRLVRPQEGAEPVLCIDEESGLITDDASEGEKFFSPDGSVAPSLQAILNLLSEVDRSQAATQIAVGSLEQAGVIAPWPLVVKKEQSEQKIDGLYRIDEPALAALAEDRFGRLRATGALPIAYGQLFSMAQLSVFQNLTNLQARLAPKPVAPLPDTLDKLFDRTDHLELKFD